VAAKFALITEEAQIKNLGDNTQPPQKFHRTHLSTCRQMDEQRGESGVGAVLRTCHSWNSLPNQPWPEWRQVPNFFNT